MVVGGVATIFQARGREGRREGLELKKIKRENSLCRLFCKLFKGIAFLTHPLWPVPIAMHLGDVGGTAGTHHTPTPPTVMTAVELQRTQ